MKSGRQATRKLLKDFQFKMGVPIQTFSGASLYPTRSFIYIWVLIVELCRISKELASKANDNWCLCPHGLRSDARLLESARVEESVRLSYGVHTVSLAKILDSF